MTEEAPDSTPGTRLGEFDELRSSLHKLRLEAGQPSLRSIAQRSGWSRATVGRVFNGEVPTWDPLEAVVMLLGGDSERFRRLWIASIEKNLSPDPVDPPDPVTVPPQDPPPRRSLSLYVSSTCLTLLFIVVSVQGIAPEATLRNQAITDAAQLGLGVLATVLWAVARRKRVTPWAWGLALGLAGWSAGQAYWLVMRDVFGNPLPRAPSIGDSLYLLLPAFAIPGLVLELPAKLRWIVTGLMAALMVSTTTATILALWVVVPGPVDAASVYGLYVVTDVTMLVLFAWHRQRERDCASTTAAIGVAVLLVSDLLFVYFAWWKPDPTIPYGADVGYLIFPLAMSIAASFALERR